MVLGPIDYTPGAFINVKPQDFKFRWTDPMVQTTRGQQLAMFVVYECPLQSVADSPDRYRNAAGFDFIKAVPADWDETRFIAGDTGEYVVLARRKGSDWYVGAMTNETARTIDVPLSFLGATKFTATPGRTAPRPPTLCPAIAMLCPEATCSHSSLRQTAARTVRLRAGPQRQTIAKNNFNRGKDNHVHQKIFLVVVADRHQLGRRNPGIRPGGVRASPSRVGAR